MIDGPASQVAVVMTAISIARGLIIIVAVAISQAGIRTQ